jgi:hypothetical protein
LELTCSDPFHLLKRSKYKFLNFWLSLCLKLNKKYLNSDLIREECKDFLSSKVFDKSPMMKMNDAVCLRLYSAKTINHMISHNSVGGEKDYRQIIVYLIVHYPLLCLSVDIAPLQM